MYAPILITQRLRLRHWKKSDLSPFAKLNSDPKVMEFFPARLSKKQSDALAEKIQKELTNHRYGLWAIELKESSEFIGFIGLHYQDFKAHFTPCIEIGWRLAFSFWGKGYATEGGKKILQYGHTTLGVKEIFSFTYKYNFRSRKVMERLHMTYDPKDDFEHPKLSKDHPLRDHVLYKSKKI